MRRRARRRAWSRRSSTAVRLPLRCLPQRERAPTALVSLRRAQLDATPTVIVFAAMLSLSPDGRYLLLPALSTAHSHAFQRAMRGAAQRPRASAAPASAVAGDDFWSWRAAMYKAASALDPESIERVSRVAFRELRAAGVRTVGEFHYVHHQPDGTPYDDRIAMSD